MPASSEATCKSGDKCRVKVFQTHGSEL